MKNIGLIVMCIFTILFFLPVTFVGVFLAFCVHAFRAGYDVGGPELIDKFLNSTEKTKKEPAEVENEN